MMTPATHNRGFTLVETLVAITVLLLVVIGPITAAQQSIKNAFYANEQVTAVFLAQEAIEAIRETRDTDALEVYDDADTDTWNWKTTLKNATPDCFNGNGCAYDSLDRQFESCTSNDNCKLEILNGTYGYFPGLGEDSGYTRIVYLDDSVSDAVSVRVEVTWTPITFGSGTERSVILQTWIYDHYQRYEDF